MNHHALIRQLISELRTTRDQLEQANNYWGQSQYATERANDQIRNAERTAREAQEQAQIERYNREMLDDAFRKAEKARSYGNDWEAERIVDHARRWYS